MGCLCGKPDVNGENQGSRNDCFDDPIGCFGCCEKVSTANIEVTNINDDNSVNDINNTNNPIYVQSSPFKSLEERIKERLGVNY